MHMGVSPRPPWVRGVRVRDTHQLNSVFLRHEISIEGP
jgi:hypothetical protein